MHVYDKLPPNDPRILALTTEQIELEFEQLKIDRKIKDGGSEFEDEEFDAYDQETEEDDARSIEAAQFDQEAQVQDEKPYNPAEWEDAEIDDLDLDDDDDDDDDDDEI